MSNLNKNQVNDLMNTRTRLCYFDPINDGDVFDFNKSESVSRSSQRIKTRPEGGDGPRSEMVRLSLSNSLPEFRPITKDPSEIITDRMRG
jgi:hypothetical protein